MFFTNSFAYIHFYDNYLKYIIESFECLLLLTFINVTIITSCVPTEIIVDPTCTSKYIPNTDSQDFCQVFRKLAVQF